MITTFSKYFWFSSAIFTLNQLLEKLGIFIPLVHSYLDDFLCPGIVLGLALFVQQQFTFQSRYYQFKPGHVVFFVLWYTLLFEVLFPEWDSRHHRDWWDGVAYSLGGLAFYFWGNKPAGRLLLKQLLSLPFYRK